MSGESDWTLPSACLAVRAVLLKGPVVIDPAFSSVWAALIIFLSLLSAQNIGDIM